MPDLQWRRLQSVRMASRNLCNPRVPINDKDYRFLKVVMGVRLVGMKMVPGTCMLNFLA